MTRFSRRVYKYQQIKSVFYKVRFWSVLLLLTTLINSCKKEEEEQTMPSVIQPQEELLSVHVEEAGIISAFKQIETAILPIPLALRPRLLHNYDGRLLLTIPVFDVASHDSIRYDCEIDYLDEKKGFMMFSLLHEKQEINFYLRFFFDSTENHQHVIALTRLNKSATPISSAYKIYTTGDTTQQDSVSTLSFTMSDFMDEKFFEKLALSPEQIMHPEVILWLPQKGNVLNAQLNLDAFGDKKSAVKSALKREKINVRWEAGAFVKEGMRMPVFRPKKGKKLAKKGKSKAPKRR